MNVSKKQIIVIILIAFFVLAGVWFYYFRISPVNYLIPGVPYNGVYNLFFQRADNLFFQRADSKVISSAMDVLGYFGDKRISLSQLQEKFPPPNILVSSVPAPFSIQDVKKFFEENGYETYYWTSADAGNEIKEIKKFVNSAKRVPVMVLQRRSPEGTFMNGMRVVIGIFDKDKKVVVHDHDFGNNYEISYDDFEKMFQSDARAILAVWPSEKIKEVVSGPDYNASYPQRLETMDKVGSILAIKRGEAESYWWRGNFEKSKALYKEIIDDANFKYFPRAFQIMTVSSLASVEIQLKQFDEAIKEIKDRALPLNYNINEPSEGWFLPEGEKLCYPYIVLSRAYLRKGEKDLSVSNYNEAKKIANSNGVSEEQFQTWFGQLEKEISSKK